MKAQLITITEEMTGSTELAEALNQNFDALNDMAHQREMAIFNRLTQMQTDINTRFDSVNDRFNQMQTDINTRFDGTQNQFDGIQNQFDGVYKRFDVIENQLNVIIDHLRGKKLLTEEDQ